LGKSAYVLTTKVHENELRKSFQLTHSGKNIHNVETQRTKKNGEKEIIRQFIIKK
jgi:hypothetical protein